MKMTAVSFPQPISISSLLLVCGLLGQATIGHFAHATPSGVSCEVKAHFGIGSVVPMWEEEMAAVGCCSRNMSERGQEVHVLHLREAKGWSPPKAVTLHVTPILERSVHAGSLVLVLHSEFSVAWRVIAERLSNVSSHRIIVTKGSQLIESRGIQVNVQRKDSGSIRHLLPWVTKRFKALTSYARIDGANNLILKVGGAGDGEPSTCDFKNRDKVSNVAAFLQEAVPVAHRQGCVVPSSKGANDRVVHVMKIHNALEDFDDERVPTRVTVHLGTRSGTPVNRDVALVLQATMPVEWVLLTGGVEGRVDLVAEGKVGTPRTNPSRPVNVRMEVFPNTTEMLLSYTRDWFGPAFTFTEVWRANAVRVFVDDVNERTDVQQKTAPESSRKGNAAAAHRPRAAVGTKEVVKAHLRSSHSTRMGKEARIVMKSRESLKASGVIRTPSVLLKDEMVVECLPRNIIVSFPRLSLERIGLHPRDISMIDSECHALVNDTHYWLSSPFHYCGMKRETDEEKVLYKNAIHFHFHVRKLTSSGTSTVQPVADSSSFPVDDEDGEFGSGDAGIFPTEDPLEAGTIPFQCDYVMPNVQSDAAMPASHSVRDATKLTATRTLFKMELFRDPSFFRNVSTEEYPFAAFEHDTLYVETHLELGSSDPGMQVVTEECWLSATDDPTSLPVALLLQDTCPTAPAVRLESTSGSASNRFSFQLSSDYVLQPLLFLHCKLGVCAADKLHNSRWGLKMCVDQRDYCDTESLRSYLERPRGTHHTVFTRGPFQVKQRSAGASRNPFASVPFRQTGQLDLEVSGRETIDVRCTLPDRQSTVILGLSTEAVVGVAFASFVIGISLSAILWCIYLKTDPLRSMHRHPTHNSGYDLSAHSGSSTPSSQSPMTA